MAARTKAGGGAGPVGLVAAAEELLTQDERRSLRRWRWRRRLESLWAPVTVLAALFLVHTVVVEAATCAGTAAQAFIQPAAVVCFGWWCALVVARLLGRRVRGRSAASADAEATLEHVAALEAGLAGLPQRSRDAVVAKEAAVLRALGGSAETVDAAVAELEQAAEGPLKGSPPRRGDSIGGFALALTVALLVRTVIVEPYRIPSGSMLPTLAIGDQIFVNKFIYGVRLPFTNTVPFVIVREPRRGDVVVFNNPMQPDRDFIKRVVGVPGDRLEFRGRTVILNGRPIELQAVDPAFATVDAPPPMELRLGSPASWGRWVSRWFVDDWTSYPQSLSLETLDGVPHWVLHSQTASMSIDETVQVPPGHVFVMGDNRDHSADSRFGLGEADRGVQFVPYGHIKGKAMVVWLSLSHGGFLSRLFGGTGYRLDRFGRPVTLCRDQPTP